eukprot:SAG31_NODE_2367_length_5855_cov_2.719597_5_plen_110_part_01
MVPSVVVTVCDCVVPSVVTVCDYVVSLPHLEEAMASVVKICFGGTLGTRSMACFLFKKMLASREAAAAEATTDAHKAAALETPLEVRCKVYYYLVDVGGPGEQRAIRLGW